MFLLTSIAAVYLMLASIVLGAARADFSHRRQTLSELGETGAPRARLVAWGVFLPVGLVLSWVALASFAREPLVAALALSIAAGYLGAAFFPCDPGAPLRGSRRQQLHNLAGALEYLGGALALVCLARAQRSPLQLIAAFLVMVAMVGLALPIFARVRGALQRVAEAALFTALALALR
jgi:hypothetical membrane protein